MNIHFCSMYQIPYSTYLFYFSKPSENIRDRLQQMNSEMKNNIRSEMKEMKERLDTLTASLQENKNEGQLYTL